ncbi:MAG: hypothetical protein IJN63_02185, partial [Clostridia bacterium]|nr:hypothetical protein [Clostridia bacterium]
LISSMLTATLVVGGTVAYLQDTDSDVNVMTVGNVYIEQHEYQRAEGVAHDAGDMGAGNGVTEGALVPFVQGQALYPAVPKNNVSTDYSAEQNNEDLFFWGDYVYSGTAGNGLWDDNNHSNVMDKMVFVENTGKSDAYFRTIIAFECPEGMTYGVEPYSQGNKLMMNVNAASYDWEEIGYVTIDGVRYWVEVATYKNILAAGNQSHPSLLQVVMTHNATNEDMELIGDSYEILAFSQAVQTAGFDNAATALDTAFGDITTTNHPWVDNAPVIPTVVVNEKELRAALKAGGNILLANDITADGTSLEVPEGVIVNLDLNGKTLANPVSGAPALANYGILTIDGEGAIVNGINNQSKSHTVRNYGHLTINGGNIGTDDTAGAAVVNDGNAIINGGTFASKQENVKSDGLCAYVFINNGAGTMIINDATFDGQTHGLFGAYNGTLIVNGGTYTMDGNGGLGCYVVYSAAEGQVVLNGGTVNTNEPRNGNVFYVYNNGSYFNANAVNIGNVVVNGVTIYKDGVEQTYTVGEKVDNAADAIAAIQAGNSITLTADIDLGTTQLSVLADKNTVIDLNGNDIIATDVGTSTHGLFNVPKGGSLTIIGDGNVTLKTNVTKGISSCIFQNDGELNIYGGYYEANQATSVAGLGAVIAVIDNCPYANDSIVNIYGGTFAITGLGASNIIRNWPINSGNAVLNIYGGTFKANPDRTTTYIWSKNDTNLGAAQSYVNIEGGTFEGNIVVEVDGYKENITIADDINIQIVEGSINGYVTKP